MAIVFLAPKFVNNIILEFKANEIVLPPPNSQFPYPKHIVLVFAQDSLRSIIMPYYSENMTIRYSFFLPVAKY